MCGIAGFVSDASPEPARARAVSAMCAAMHHRGPDDHGLYSGSIATIGSCRLAIFDPANGHQPMFSPDRRWSMVFNGAIYNFKALRHELADSWEFRTECDTEVLLAAYCRWGEGCLARLRGMFAFAVWDEVERTLFLARDPFGIKPLFVFSGNGGLLFASELNALLASGKCPAQLDVAAIADYLAWFAVPAPRTIYRDVISLRPGECATWRKGALEVRRAWDFDRIAAVPAARDPAEFQRGLRAQLEDTIRAHMLADVPVGAFLSGGLDSAVVVGLMTKVTGRPMRTFCIGFDDTQRSEAAAAASTARHFGAEHHTHILTGAEVANDLPRILAALDQPTGDGINTYYASQAARAGGVTVALSGLGGDELFGGYPSFRGTPRLARVLPYWSAVPKPARDLVLRRLRRGDTRRRKLADILQHARTINEVGALQRRVFSEPGRWALLRADFAERLGHPSPFHPELAWLTHELAEADEFAVVSAWELRTYMADVLLRDSDVMSMRQSLELRVPFVDRNLIEWLWRQPLRGTAENPKAALYDAVADLLPPDLASRKKQGFTLPFSTWMKSDLRPFLEDTFARGSIGQSGLFSTEGVRGLWRGFLEGRDSREWSRVWSLAVLIAFANSRASAPANEPSAVAISAAKPKPREVLVMAPEIYASEGGIPRILQLYLRALCTPEAGNRVRLLALNDSPGDSRDAQRTLAPALLESIACRRNKPRFVRHALRLARQSDIIICGHVAQLPVAWMARRLNPKLKYYLVAHGIEVWRPFSMTERVAMEGAERILCVSDYTRRELRSRCSLPEAKTVVLHNGLDPRFEISAGLPLSACPPRILCVSRITYADRYKGLEHLIEAMPAVRAAVPAASLRLIGRGDDVERLQALAASIGASEYVEFTGYLDDDALRKELNQCRLFALPSRKEGFGLVFIEAMAHGRPCLGANAGGVPEVITPESGVLVEYGDVPGIAAAAIEALGRRWDERAIAARATAFSFASFLDKLNHLLPS